MAPVTRREFAALLRSLDPTGFRQFVADLWRRRGWDVRIAGDRLLLEREGEERRLLVRHDSRRSRFPTGLGSGRPGSVPTDTGGVDAVVTSAPDRSPGPGTEVIDAIDLYRIALYGIDRTRCDEVFVRHFDRHLASPPPGTDPGGGRLRPLEDGLASVPGSPRSIVAFLAVALVLAVGVSGSLTSPLGNDVPAAPTPGILAAGGELSDSDRLTAAPTPTDVRDRGRNSRRVGGGYPPGLAPAGITDADEIADGHAQAITGRSYRWELTYREFVDGRGVALRRERVRVESPRRYVSRVWGMGDATASTYVIAEASTYADGERRFEADPAENGMEYTVRRADLLEGGEGHFADRAETYIRWFLSVRESNVVDVRERGGITFYWIVTDGDPWPGVVNTTGSALVDSRGIVHEVHRTYDVPDSGDVSVSVTLRYTDIGTTTVDPPDWYGAALNATRANTTRSQQGPASVRPTGEGSGVGPTRARRPG